MRFFYSLLMLGFVSGCGDSKYAELSSAELQDRYAECESAESLSPGAAITCDNVRRECDRRASSMGRKVCF